MNATLIDDDDARMMMHVCIQSQEKKNYSDLSDQRMVYDP